jgi:hypothetical protein
MLLFAWCCFSKSTSSNLEIDKVKIRNRQGRISESDKVEKRQGQKRQGRKTTRSKNDKVEKQQVQKATRSKSDLVKKLKVENHFLGFDYTSLPISTSERDFGLSPRPIM